MATHILIVKRYLWCAVLFKFHALSGAVAFSVLTTLPAIAQIVPDGTLGDEGSILTEGLEVRGDLADLVEGGAARGSNLFHSFSEFNVDGGQRVYFANPVGIESILSRVTGDNPSSIFGVACHSICRGSHDNCRNLKAL